MIYNLKFGRQVGVAKSRHISYHNMIRRSKHIVPTPLQGEKVITHHHHQPINVPTTGAQAFLWITHIRKKGYNPPRGPSACWWVLMSAKAAGTNGLTCLPKSGGARDDKFLVTHSMTDQCCLTFAIARRSS
jgi:hypothetical protein